ncbi:hypothetical protein TL16_g08754 [Triparma laevis f. inornata]|uniref:Uncharacterized protein n=1 Tax=Triparma laevis f. inornata TaxID=1714386 RepID=A0A9W7EK87_9STRA|nr:hypothetical protein TL16_g08754 [Triparma laevis f. inornata]
MLFPSEIVKVTKKVRREFYKFKDDEVEDTFNEEGREVIEEFKDSPEKIVDETDDTGGVVGDDDYVLLGGAENYGQGDKKEDKKADEEGWLILGGYPVDTLYGFDCNEDGEEDVIGGFKFESEGVYVNALVCYDYINKRVVWSSTLEITRFKNNWMFDLDIFNYRGYVLTSLCKLVSVDLKTGRAEPMAVGLGGREECFGGVVEEGYWANGERVERVEMDGRKKLGGVDVRGRAAGWIVRLGENQLSFWRIEEQTALLYVLNSKTLKIKAGYPLQFGCNSGHVSVLVTIGKLSEGEVAKLRGVKGGVSGTKVAFTVDNALVYLDVDSFEISETNLGFTSTVNPYTRTHESGTVIGVAGAGRWAEYRIEEVGGGRWEKGRKGGRRDAREGEVVVEDMEVKGGWVRVVYDTNGFMGDMLSGTVEIWEGNGAEKKLFGKQGVTGEAIFWGGAIPRTMELELVVRKSSGARTSQGFVVHYNENVLEGLEWLVLLPMLFVGVAIGGYDDEKRKKKEFRDEIFGEDVGGGVGGGSGRRSGGGSLSLG